MQGTSMRRHSSWRRARSCGSTRVNMTTPGSASTWARTRRSWLSVRTSDHRCSTESTPWNCAAAARAIVIQVSPVASETRWRWKLCMNPLRFPVARSSPAAFSTHTSGKTVGNAAAGVTLQLIPSLSGQPIFRPGITRITGDPLSRSASFHAIPVLSAPPGRRAAADIGHFSTADAIPTKPDRLFTAHPGSTGQSPLSGLQHQLSLSIEN